MQQPEVGRGLMPLKLLARYSLALFNVSHLTLIAFTLLNRRTVSQHYTRSLGGKRSQLCKRALRPMKCLLYTSNVDTYRHTYH